MAEVAYDNAQPAIETVELGMRFGDFIALEDLSIRFRPGTVHALLGENGAGKSTLVKCLIGYQRPSSGQFIVLPRIASECTNKYWRRCFFDYAYSL